MNILQDHIKKNRPSLSTSSIKTYTSILKNLYCHVFTDAKKGDIDLSKFDDSKRIIDYLKNVEFSKRKTYLSALYIISKNDAYQQLMISDIKKTNEQDNKQEMTPTQEANWVSQKEIKDMFDKYAKNVKLLLMKDSLDVKELQYFQNYLILALMSGVYIPPRRLKDWCDLKIKNFDKNDDNYIELVAKSKPKRYAFIFNSYKTAKFYGAEKVDIPNDLYKLIIKYSTLTNNDYLLIDSKGLQLSPVKLNQRLNKIFGKATSCNILRHSYLTEKYANIPALQEMQQVANDMGHSVGQALLYVKNKPSDDK